MALRPVILADPSQLPFSLPDDTFRNALVTRSPAYSPSQACLKVNLTERRKNYGECWVYDSGRILKMEVDYSETVDEKIPVCQKLCQ
ncbi:hypothetical protein TNCT_168971, partial [Trichonephila clavata]